MWQSHKLTKRSGLDPPPFLSFCSLKILFKIFFSRNNDLKSRVMLRSSCDNLFLCILHSWVHSDKPFSLSPDYLVYILAGNVPDEKAEESNVSGDAISFTCRQSVESQSVAASGGDPVTFGALCSPVRCSSVEVITENDASPRDVAQDRQRDEALQSSIFDAATPGRYI